MKYLIFFVILITINTILIYNYKFISKLINIYDYPNFRKIHSTPTPLIGGVIIFINIIFFFIYFEIFSSSILHLLIEIHSFKHLYLTLTIYSSLFFLGLYDDKYPIAPNKKLAFQLIFIGFFIYFDQSLAIKNLDIFFIENVSLNRISLVFTLICVIFFLNIMNMFDGINLQSSIIYFFLLLFLIIHSNYEIFLSVVLISLIFFSCLNYKGKIFLGDSGSYLLALSIAHIFLKDYNNYLGTINLENFLCFLIFPAFDSLRLFINRIVKGKNIFSPDKKHLHHLLLFLIGYRKTILLIFIIYLGIFSLTNLNLFEPYINFLIISILYFLIFIYINYKFHKNNKDI